MVSIPLAFVTMIALATAAYTVGYARGVHKTEQLVRDHRDAMNAKYNCMKLEAQEKLRKQREVAGE